jgi:hypothetical protein
MVKYIIFNRKHGQMHTVIPWLTAYVW